VNESYWQADKEKSLSLGVYRDPELWSRQNFRLWLAAGAALGVDCVLFYKYGLEKSH
jgi:hypothetical protein